MPDTGENHRVDQSTFQAKDNKKSSLMFRKKRGGAARDDGERGFAGGVALRRGTKGIPRNGFMGTNWRVFLGKPDPSKILP